MTSLKKVVTAISCPCNVADCDVLIRVGTYGDMGIGQKNCPHCGHLPCSKWNGKEEFIAHLDSNDCRKKRRLGKHPSARARLGPHLCHRINDPDYNIDGELFKCFACDRTVKYKDRYEHAVNCFPKKNISLPPL